MTADSSGQATGTLPAPNTLEVSVFGPGFGECVVVHLGGGEWMVVDSCLNDSREPVALAYISNLGLDPARAIRVVVVTHWHDDHMRGASRVLEAAPNASLVCSGALKKREFFTLVASDDQLAMMASESSGVSEFARVFRLLGTRGGFPEWAAAAQRIFFRAAAGAIPECEVFALSPSNATVTAALQALAALIPRIPGDTKRAFVSPEPNQAAVVLHVRVGEQCVLLGADLETGAHESRGWLGVLNDARKPTGRAAVYKVAHHGSMNADHGRIWTELLTAQPVAALTPFSRGSVSLPRNADVARIKARTSLVFSAAKIGPPPSARRTKPVDRTIAETARRFRLRAGRMGQIRVRIAEDEVRLFDAALQL